MFSLNKSIPNNLIKNILRLINIIFLRPCRLVLKRKLLFPVGQGPHRFQPPLRRRPELIPPKDEKGGGTVATKTNKSYISYMAMKVKEQFLALIYMLFPYYLLPHSIHMDGGPKYQTLVTSPKGRQERKLKKTRRLCNNVYITSFHLLNFMQI